MKLNVNNVKFYGPSDKVIWGQNHKINEYWLEGNIKVKIAKDDLDNFWYVKSNGTVTYIDKISNTYKTLFINFKVGNWVETKGFKKNIG